MYEVQIDVDQIGFPGIAGAASEATTWSSHTFSAMVRGRASVVILDYLTIWNVSISL